MGDIIGFVNAMDRLYCKTETIPGKLCFKWVIAGGSYAGAFTAWIT